MLFAVEGGRGPPPRPLSDKMYLRSNPLSFCMSPVPVSSRFGGLFGDHPRIRILVTLIDAPFVAFTVEEMADRARVTPTQAFNLLTRLVEQRICLQKGHAYCIDVNYPRLKSWACGCRGCPVLRNLMCTDLVHTQVLPVPVG